MSSVSLALAEAPLILALDIGTSSARALWFDRRGRAIAGSECQVPYRLSVSTGGEATLDPAELLATVAGCIDGAVQHAGSRIGDAAAVATSAFWHSLMGLDAHGAPTTPVLLWADRRSGDDARVLRRELDAEDVHQRTGCVLHSSFWPAKLRWIARSDAGSFGGTKRWCGFPEYLLQELTGASGMSVSMASGTGMLRTAAVDWDPNMIAANGISPYSLPRLVDGGAAAMLATPWDKRWPGLAHVPWLPPLGDGACANAGCGAVAPDRIALTLGTSGAIRVVRDPEEALDAVPAGYWRYRLDRETAIDGAAISNGGQVLTWLMDLLRLDFSDEDLGAAETIGPDGHGLTVLPFLAGERAPIWNDEVRGAIVGLTLATERPALVRAGMEAVALRLARIYGELTARATSKHAIVATGGAILRSPLWLQITADALGHDVIALQPEEEASARGAAIVALRDLGLIRDLRDVDDPVSRGTLVQADADRHSIYRRAMERQRHLEALLFPEGAPWDHDAKELQSNTK